MVSHLLRAIIENMLKNQTLNVPTRVEEHHEKQYT